MIKSYRVLPANSMPFYKPMIYKSIRNINLRNSSFLIQKVFGFDTAKA